MQTEEYVFPQFRKLKNIDLWIQINSKSEWIEIKRSGSIYFEDKFKAIQYPEKLRIQDMLVCEGDRWEIISSNDFHKVLAESRQKK